MKNFGPTEYCEAEEFAPDCHHGHVVVMTMALYGRMTKGRCAKVDYGFMGCSADVLSVMDVFCSGRESCNVRIPDTRLDDSYDCTGEFKTYLNASYSCVPVETSQCTQCETSISPGEQKARLSLPEGFLASWVTTTRSGCGSSNCPWVIEAQPGQKINLTLYDFSDHTQMARNSWNIPCSRFGMIKEDASPKDTPICRSRERERHLFTSVSNKVEISVVSPAVLKMAGHFLLHYQAVGCPDYEPPDKMFFRRADNHITVGCTHGDTTWDLYCKGTEWVGTIGVCPDAPLNPPQGPISLPLGVLIAIVVGIALVIGVLILTVGIVCLKRQQNDLHQRSETTLYVRARPEPEYPEDMRSDTRFKYETTPLYTQKAPVRVLLPPPQHRTAAHGGPRENLYFRRMESRPLPSLPHAAAAEEQQPLAPPQSHSDDDADKYRIQVHRTGSGREQHGHYQPRVVTKKAHSTGSSSRDDPQYFVLDPDDPVPEEEDPVEEEGATAAPVAAAAAAAAPRPQRKRTPSGPPITTTTSTPGQRSAASCVASTHHSGSGRIEGNTSNNQPPTLSRPNQKSPEEENCENDTKEVHMNNSCHEIPLRPSREGSQTSKVPEVATSTGNSSWP